MRGVLLTPCQHFCLSWMLYMYVFLGTHKCACRGQRLLYRCPHQLVTNLVFETGFLAKPRIQPDWLASNSQEPACPRSPKMQLQRTLPCIPRGLLGCKLRSVSERASPLRPLVFSFFVVAILSGFEVIVYGLELCLLDDPAVFSCAFLVICVSSLEHCLFKLPI